MIWVVIALVAALCLVAGYSARQLQEERESADTIKEQAAEIKGLIRENETLRRDKNDHETNLGMLLGELDTSS